ncbi:2-oxo acid dehydrogenase subunit E2 [Chitinophagaceae bacterium LB-8]|uniref:Dihydrolipoamide acetyltransferase component of pyruvate dehydrogenase complex n=1 Tax=Paraflavisolibacter caeni TaxID=2982496 RepID=A0A9X2XWY8_9BACT|nr:dihydrolipoamide acetyltransferase family protein [Paraflavisolibacter caeni]MCU7550796.1 2-oxo acid dehydrogenase subunit E2 [Paraflavisolibacter caeni]
MAIVDLVMPKMGESIMEATILKWHKKPGDAVKMDETVLEIATDKVDSEVPSTAEGVIEEVLFQENDVVPIGNVIARIKTDVAKEENGNGGQGTIHPGRAEKVETIETTTEVSYHSQDESSFTSSLTNNHKPQTAGRFYSPLVLNIAAQEGISMTELEHIPGTGNEGRVTKKDILQYVNDKKEGKLKRQPESTITRQDQPMVIPMNRVEAENNALVATTSLPSGNVEIIEMDRMRRLIADHMVRSLEISAHVTSFTEADVTNLVLWREKVKKDFEKREGTKLTFTPLLIEAIVRCIKKFPLVNSSVDGNRIIVKKDINIGMATALPSGNLIVPVIRNAGQLNLSGLAKQVNALADNARNNRLKPEDIAEGTFTFTNVGTFGSLMGTPIINQPQVAILAAGTIKKRPVVVETPMGDSIAIRHMMYLSMSYDHRIIDGSLGATFLTAVANELENFNPNREG